MKKLILLMLVAAAGSESSCTIFAPFGLDALADTRINDLCHFAFTCCTPLEREDFITNLGVDVAELKDEGSCQDELHNTQGGAYEIDQLARDAVSRGKATYDGDKATSCSQKQVDAINSCKIADLVDNNGEVDSFKVFALVDSEDATCAALAIRDFTTGTVKDGGACESDFDCADFGRCVVADDDASVETVKGKCQALHGSGDDCSDGVACQPGLSCNAADGKTTCGKVDKLAIGTTCEVDSDCDSGNCASSGTCFNNPNQVCSDDTDCTSADDFCNTTASSCAAAKKVTADFCNGLN